MLPFGQIIDIDILAFAIFLQGPRRERRSRWLPELLSIKCGSLMSLRGRSFTVAALIGGIGLVMEAIDFTDLVDVGRR